MKRFCCIINRVVCFLLSRKKGEREKRSEGFFSLCSAFSSSFVDGRDRLEFSSTRLAVRGVFRSNVDEFSFRTDRSCLRESGGEWRRRTSGSISLVVRNVVLDDDSPRRARKSPTGARVGRLSFAKLSSVVSPAGTSFVPTRIASATASDLDGSALPGGRKTPWSSVGTGEKFSFLIVSTIRFRLTSIA